MQFFPEQVTVSSYEILIEAAEHSYLKFCTFTTTCTCKISKTTYAFTMAKYTVTGHSKEESYEGKSAQVLN